MLLLSHLSVHIRAVARYRGGYRTAARLKDNASPPWTKVNRNGFSFGTVRIWAVGRARNCFYHRWAIWKQLSQCSRLRYGPFDPSGTFHVSSLGGSLVRTTWSRAERVFFRFARGIRNGNIVPFCCTPASIHIQQYGTEGICVLVLCSNILLNFPFVALFD